MQTLEKSLILKDIIKDSKGQAMPEEKDKNEYGPVPPLETGSGKDVDNKSLLEQVGIIDKNFVFQYKKTEKIIAALYLVTDFLSEEEPIRWQLREIGLSTLSNVMSLKDTLPSQKNELCSAIKTEILEMVSLLDIGLFAGLFSTMNVTLLKREFEALLGSISHTQKTLESFVLPDTFFAETDVQTPTVDTGILPTARPLGVSLSRTEHRARDVKDISFQGQKVSTQATKETHSGAGVVEVKRSRRQSLILNLLKKKKEIMIKDVTAIISDCSEKTLQRELLSMVELGILRKEGERRWSKYFLA